MNTTKNIQKSYGSIIALVLLLFFSIAGFAKAVSVHTAVFYKTAKQSTGKVLCAALEKQAEISAAAGVQDNDADDADWQPFITAGKATMPVAAYKADSKQIVIYFHRVQPGSNHLYDLYCNWKYDL